VRIPQSNVPTIGKLERQILSRSFEFESEFFQNAWETGGFANAESRRFRQKVTRTVSARAKICHRIPSERNQRGNQPATRLENFRRSLAATNEQPGSDQQKYRCLNQGYDGGLYRAVDD
jgi:hypothetical protein